MSNMCFSGANNAACGKDGNPCVSCGSGLSCVANVCSTGSGGGGGSGTGGGAGTGGGTGTGGGSGDAGTFDGGCAITCAGCCDALDHCQTGDQDLQCGSLGQSCQNCTDAGTTFGLCVMLSQGFYTCF
jgi:hypothetical protein